MNTELIQILISNDYISQIPQGMSPADAKYYPMLENIREENRLLKIRYQEVRNFFVYAQEPDLLIGDNGMVFAESQVTGLLAELQKFSREGCQKEYFDDRMVFSGSRGQYLYYWILCEKS